MTFNDRHHAGRLLAESLAAYQNRTDVLVLALPRGGVLVGHEISARLAVPLDTLVVRKIGLPGYPEMAIGAIAPDGIKLISEKLIKQFHVSPEALRRVIAAEEEELRRRIKAYRGDRSQPDLHDKVVILVDDGLATGRTIAAAIAWTRLHRPREIIVAVPVGAAGTCHTLSHEVDQLICLDIPPGFCAVGAAYLDFHEVTDDEVLAALRGAEGSASPSAASSQNLRSAIPRAS